MNIKITADFRCFKGGESFELLNTDPDFCIIVGKNGSGKSTILQAIRGKYDKENTSLYQSDFINIAKNVEIECMYDKFFFLDGQKDNGSDMNNAYDAMSYIKSGGMATKDISHGQSQIYYLIQLMENIKKWRGLNPNGKALVVLDEFDKGFDLFNQSKCFNIIRNIFCNFNCNIICATHNIFLIRDGLFVYDMDNKQVVTSENYLKQFNNKTI